MGVKSRKWMPEEMEAGGGVSRVILILFPHSRQIQYLVLSSQSLPPSSSLVETARTKVWELEPLLSSPTKDNGYNVDQSNKDLVKASEHASGERVWLSLEGSWAKGVA